MKMKSGVFRYKKYVINELDREYIVQDIILIITMVLSGDYSTLVDLNEDGVVNILDIVQVTLIILNPEP